ncbi:MAG: hypothetical protein ACUVXJ_08785 [Phycisphaerae bacterium]
MAKDVGGLVGGREGKGGRCYGSVLGLWSRTGKLGKVLGLAGRGNQVGEPAEARSAGLGGMMQVRRREALIALP